MLKILIVQPGYAHYRKELFNRLNFQFDILYVFLRGLSNYPTLDTPNKQWKTICLNSEKNKLWIINLIILLLREKYDIVISSIPGSAQSGISLLITKVLKKSHVIWNETWHEEYKYSSKPRLYKLFRKKIARYIIRRSNSVIVPGTASLKYHKNIGIPEGKIFVANQSAKNVDEKTKNVLKKSDFKMNNKYVILYLSRIIKVKGLDILIKAFHKLEILRNDVFLLIGGDGPYRSHCENISNQLKVKNIKFIGSVMNDCLYKYFNISDIFVLPSCSREQTEFWGLIINEAMSASKPIITTDAVGAADDLVKNGVNGYVVKNNNIEDMYHALNKIICGGDVLIKDMGKKSKEIFEKFNDYDKMFSGFQKAISYSIKKRTISINLY